MLTEAEIGKEQFEKAKLDRARFRGVPGQAREYAASRGEQAAWRLRMVNDPNYSDEFARDAVMFAAQAFKGWRAYRIMKG